MKDTTPIVKNFFDLFENKQGALDFINEACGTAYKYSNMYAWVDPTKSDMARNVYELMLREVLRANKYDEAFSLIAHSYQMTDKAPDFSKKPRKKKGQPRSTEAYYGIGDKK